MSPSVKDRTIDLTADVEVRDTLPFSWLSLDQWTPDNLMDDSSLRVVERYCRMCDEFVAPTKAEDHVQEHKDERIALLAEKREQNKEQLADAREAARAEKKAEKEQKKKDRKDEPVVKRAPRVKRDTTYEWKLPPDAEHFTVTLVSELNDKDRNETRNALINMVAAGDLIVAGIVKSGGRGRPATLYARNKS